MAQGIISSGLFDFFAELAAHRDRDWFQANKSRYETLVKAPMRDLVGATNAALAARDVPLSGDPKRSVSRINRDVRFSADKSPYKTYTAATFTREPGEMSPGMIYLQLAPGECFAGLGFYAVEPADLARLREAIVARPDKWKLLTASLAGVGHPLEDGEPLRRMPKGFEAHAATPVADDLKRRMFVVKLWLTPDEAAADLPQRIAAFAADCRPLLDFGWHAIGAQPQTVAVDR